MEKIKLAAAVFIGGLAAILAADYLLNHDMRSKGQEFIERLKWTYQEPLSPDEVLRNANAALEEARLYLEEQEAERETEHNVFGPFVHENEVTPEQRTKPQLAETVSYPSQSKEERMVELILRARNGEVLDAGLQQEFARLKRDFASKHARVVNLNARFLRGEEFDTLTLLEYQRLQDAFLRDNAWLEAQLVK